MINAMGLSIVMLAMPSMLLLYYLPEAVQLESLFYEGETIAYVIRAFQIISIYLLGVLAMYIHVRWHEKNIAHFLEDRKTWIREWFRGRR